MATLKQFIEENGFYKFDLCINAGVYGGFECLEFGNITSVDSNIPGWLYLWVIEINDQPVCPIYIGQTEGTLTDRMLGHRNGSILGRSQKGYGNANYIKRFKQEFNQQHSIRVYCRLSKKIKILNYDVPIGKAEEFALMELFMVSHLGHFLLNRKTTEFINLNITNWFSEIKEFLAGDQVNLPDGLTFY